MSSVCEVLLNASIRFQAETDSGGFSRIVLTDEAYDKMVMEMGSKIIYGPNSSIVELFLSDRFVNVERETPYGTEKDCRDPSQGPELE